VAGVGERHDLIVVAPHDARRDVDRPSALIARFLVPWGLVPAYPAGRTSAFPFVTGGDLDYIGSN